VKLKINRTIHRQTKEGEQTLFPLSPSSPSSHTPHVLTLVFSPPVTQVIEQPTMQIEPGKHYSFVVGNAQVRKTT
jgi:hypothetical protein